MPKYDWKCEACGEVFERYVPLTSIHNPTDCPVCAKPCKRLPHYGTLQVSIPESFRQATGSEFHSEPKTPEEKAKWDREGIHRAKDVWI